MIAAAPAPRNIAAVVVDVEAQFKRGQVVTMLPSELRRLLAAARDGHVDALRIASALPEAS